MWWLADNLGRRDRDPWDTVLFASSPQATLQQQTRAMGHVAALASRQTVNGQRAYRVRVLSMKTISHKECKHEEREMNKRVNESSFDRSTRVDSLAR